MKKNWWMVPDLYSICNHALIPTPWISVNRHSLTDENIFILYYAFPLFTISSFVLQYTMSHTTSILNDIWRVSQAFSECLRFFIAIVFNSIPCHHENAHSLDEHCNIIKWLMSIFCDQYHLLSFLSNFVIISFWVASSGLVATLPHFISTITIPCWILV